MTRPSLATVGAGVLALVLLSGCTDAPQSDPASQPTSGSSADSASDTELAPGTIVATGTIAARDASVSGSVTIAKDADGYRLTLADYHSALPAPIVPELTAAALSPQATCFDNGFGIRFGTLSSEQEQTLEIGPLKEFGKGDPSFLDDVVFTQHVPADAKNVCLEAVVAVAALTWTIPETRPDLTVVDSGSTGGARGEVTLEGGEPISYLVAPDDVLPEIAARFGITVDDLLFLNPARGPAGQHPIAYAGETLNLSTALR